MKINRNDECWCNSGLKYKKCHMECIKLSVYRFSLRLYISYFLYVYKH